MGIEDKASNMGEDLKGKAKEAAGKVTDNERLEAEGKRIRPRRTSSSGASSSRTRARTSRTPSTADVSGVGWAGPDGGRPTALSGRAVRGRMPSAGRAVAGSTPCQHGPSVRLDGTDDSPSRGPAVTTTHDHRRPSVPAPTADEIAVDGRLVAGQQLPDDRADLPAGQPAAARAAAPEHIKPRLLGHWGTSPGLSFIYAHVSRLIRHTGQETIYLAGPGHGGPALVAAGYLEGTYTEIYPRRHARTSDGHAPALPPVLRARRHPEPRLGDRRPARSTRAASSATSSCTPSARSWTTPTCSRSPWSATARPRPARSRAPGRASPSSTRRATAPCCRSCTSTAPRSPARRCSAARTRPRSAALLEGHGYDVLEVEGDDLPGMHHRFAEALAEACGRIRGDPGGGPRRRLGRQPAALADDRPAHAEGLDRPGRGRRRQGRPAPGARTRCRCRASRTTPSTCAARDAGCGPTGRRSSSTTTARPTELVRRPTRRATCG